MPVTIYSTDIYIRNSTGISYIADINYYYCKTLKDNKGHVQLISGDDTLITSVTSEICSPIKIVINSFIQININTNQQNIIAINYLKDLKRERVYETSIAIPKVINNLIDIFSSRERIDVYLPIQAYLESIYLQTSNEDSMNNKIIYVLSAKFGRFKLEKLDN